MGPEPFLDAMDAHPDFDVIIGGRAYDPSPYVAYCTHQLKQQIKGLTEEDIQSRTGGFLHMGKIMECGGFCSLPKSHGAVSTVYADGLFDVRPTAPDSICTPLSVAAHTLYENTRPDLLRGPGGVLDLTESKHEQLADGRSVRVRGARFRPCKESGKPYQLKLEAARIVGYRTLFLGSVKDCKTSNPYRVSVSNKLQISSSPKSTTSLLLSRATSTNNTPTVLMNGNSIFTSTAKISTQLLGRESSLSLLKRSRLRSSLPTASPPRQGSA